MKLRSYRGVIMVHKGIFMALCTWLAIQGIFVVETDGLRTLRIRSRNTTASPSPMISTRSTTSIPLTQASSASTSTIQTQKPKSPRRVRVRRLRVQKRQGAFADGPEVGREPLYQDHSDEYEVPSHYYSPIKRQRQRGKQKKFFQEPRQQQQYIQPYSQGSSSPSDLDYNDRNDPRYYDPNGRPTEEELALQRQEQPAPKNYAFAYAVRDDHNAEDFSHKEARDGKLTMGEYRINLPDGRVQVVRYTAGGDIGYKADVTYEGDDPRNKELTSKPKTLSTATGYYPNNGGRSSPTSAVPKKYRYKEPPQNSDPSYPYDEPVYRSRPLKSIKIQPLPSPTYRPRPSLSYASYPLSATPSPNYSNNKRPSPTPSYNYNSNSNSNGRPKSIYDKMSTDKKDYTGNLAFLHEQSPRAGPARTKKKISGGNLSFNHDRYSPSQLQFLEENVNPSSSYSYPGSGSGSGSNLKKLSKSKSKSTPAALYNEPGPGNYYSASGPPPPPPFPSLSSNQFPKYPKPVSPNPTPSEFTYEDHDHNDYDSPKSSGVSPYSFGTFTPINFKSGRSKALIPIDEFKAGPSRKKRRKKISNSNTNSNSNSNYRTPDYDPFQQVQVQSQFQPQPQSLRYKEPFHYYNSQHPSYHHGGYTPPTPPVSINQVGISHSQSVNPSLSSYNIDYPGGKHSFYLKTSPGPLKKRKKGTTSSGLVYLETPGVGPRPTQLGVKDILSQLPNMPLAEPNTLSSPHLSSPHTTIHPYEIGSKDYGKSVGYKNSFNTPSDDEGDHQDFSRDYLVDNTQDAVVGEKRERQRPQEHAQFHKQVLTSAYPSPTPEGIGAFVRFDQGPETEFQYDSVK